MRFLRSILFATLTLISFGNATSQTKIYELRNGHVLERAEVISSDLFTEVTLRTIADKFVSQHKQFRVMRLLIVTNKHDIAFDRYGKGVDHYGFSTWLNMSREEQKAKPFAVAEMWRIGKNSILHVRWKDGSVRVIGDQGAFDKMFGGSIHLSYMRILDTGIIPDFYFKSDAVPTSAQGKELTLRIRRKFGIARLQIALRQDNWFIADSEYPWLNPFEVTGREPTWAEYKSHPEFFCTAWHPKEDVRCIETGWSMLTDASGAR